MSDELPQGRSFVAICKVLWRYKLVVLGGIAVFSLLAVFLALTATEYFRGETVTVPARSGNMGGGGLQDSLGGLSALGLLSSDSEIDTAIAVLNSHELAEQFIRRYGVLVELNKHASKPLTMWYAVKQFQEHVVNIKKDARKGTTSVIVEWTDAATAARWANDYVGMANEIMRKHAMEESQRNVAFLNSQMAKTEEVEVRRAIFNIVESEMRSAMLANGRIDFAFQVVDPAVAAERRVRPMRTVMVIVGALVGFTLAAIFALIHDNILSARRRLPSSH